MKNGVKVKDGNGNIISESDYIYNETKVICAPESCPGSVKKYFVATEKEEQPQEDTSDDYDYPF